MTDMYIFFFNSIHANLQLLIVHYLSEIHANDFLKWLIKYLPFIRIYLIYPLILYHSAREEYKSEESVFWNERNSQEPLPILLAK